MFFELSIHTAFMLYLALTLFVLLGIWINQHYKSRHREILPVEKSLFVCEYCHFTYLSEDEKPVTKCPQCHSFNKDNSFKKK